MAYAAQIVDGVSTRVCVGAASENAAVVKGEWIDLPSKAGPGWVRSDEISGGVFRPWVQVAGAGLGPEGAESGYPAGATVHHRGHVWTSPGGGNVWEPGVAGWHRADKTWLQPTGSSDAYARGQEVVRNGQRWRSTVNANVWAPGVFGWERA